MVLLFGPFAIVFLSKLLGWPMPEGWFGAWFMGALTAAGAITTVSFVPSVKRHGPSELGCVLPLAAITCWWGYVFLKEIGALQ